MLYKALETCSLRQPLAFIFVLLLICALCWESSAAPQTSQQAWRVEGVVLDGRGAPVGGAQVSLSVASSVISETATGDDGRFVFAVVREGAVTITVHARGFASAERSWSSSERDAPPLKFVLAPAPIEEQVTVTATRTETRLGETAASVVVLSARELSTTAALTIDDALRQVPGFQLFRRSGSRTANPTSQGVSLRGVGASGASRALVLADGIPLNDPFGGWVYWGRVPRESVSSIEILRGGSSDLYGSAALGGVVHILTRRAAAPALSLEASYGNQQTPDASLFAGGRRGRWGATLAAEIFHTDGYILVDEDERGPVDTPAGSRHATLDLSLERRIDREGRVFLRAAYFGEARANGTPLQTNRTHIRQLSAGADWPNLQVGSISVRAYTSAQVYDQNFSAVSADRASEVLTRVQRVPAQVTGFTAQWSRAVGPIQTFVAGLDAREVRGASDELVFVQNRPSSIVGAGGRERTIGLYAEDILRLSERLFITGGVRFDRWRNYAALQTTRPVRGASQATVNQFPDRAETAFSPQLSVLYRPIERVSLTASAYRAFRQPSLNELYRSFRVGDVLTLANERLRAERLTGGEAGASVASLDHRMGARATFFWTETTRPIANVTLTVVPGLITRQRQNLGRTRSRGLELEAEAQLDKHWNITGGYLFSDATVRRFPANTELEGLLIPQVARHQLAFQIGYAKQSLITAGLQGRMTGAQYDDDQNRFQLDRYFTLDALASRRLTHGLEVFAAAENLLNKRYEIGRTPVVTVGPPLLVRFGLRLRLGSQ